MGGIAHTLVSQRLHKNADSKVGHFKVLDFCFLIFKITNFLLQNSRYSLNVN